jgi:drug/metabolite transporter (DMT)-like permease
MHIKFKALAAIIVCMLFWGFSFVSSKIALAAFPPMTLGLFRFILAVAFLFVIKRRIAPKERLKKADIPLLLASGLAGDTFYFLCENNGLALIPASEASIITAAIPVLMLFVEMFVDRGTKVRVKGKLSGRQFALNSRRWFGAALSMAGVWMVARVSFRLTGNATGYVYLAGSAVCWVAYSFLTKPLFDRGRSRIYIVLWQSAAGLLGFIPFSLFETPIWSNVDMAIVLHLLFLGICCSALAYLFYAQSLQVLGIAVSAVFINFIPVITVTAGIFVLGERLSPPQWLGAAMTIAGVCLAMGVFRRETNHRIFT